MTYWAHLSAAIFFAFAAGVYATRGEAMVAVPLMITACLMGDCARISVERDKIPELLDTYE